MTRNKQTQKEESFRTGEVKSKREWRANNAPRGGCIICGGPHWAKECEHSLPNCTWEESKEHYENCTKREKESHEDSDGTSASSDKDDEDDDEENEDKPKLAGKKTKASKGKAVKKTTFKDEVTKHCYEVNLEEVKAEVSAAATTSRPRTDDAQVYDELDAYIEATMSIDEITAAVRSIKKQMATPMPPTPVEPVANGDGDTEVGKGGTLVKLKDNPGEIGEWLEIAKKKKKKKGDN